MKRFVNRLLPMSLLIAFAASTAAASVPGSAVADVLARERGIQVSAESVSLQISNAECSVPRVLRLRTIGHNLEVVLHCNGARLPIIAVVKSEGLKARPVTVSANMTALVPAIVRRGAMVRLLMNGDKFRMAMPAVSLDSGCEGAKVRVRFPGTNQIHIAKVAGMGFVIEDAA